jgi:membrane-associated protease RseP (regulator of RpoE activity)
LLPLVLFLATCASTFWVGVSKWSPIVPLAPAANAMWDTLFFSAPFDQQSLLGVRKLILANWDIGLAYMFCVILIIFLHEMGHFVATLIYKVPASYPFFLPLPINPIGTMGAVIAMHGYVANRKQIFDIGLAGPIAGLIAAVPISYYGVGQLDLTTPELGGLGFRLPWLLHWFAQLWEVPGYEQDSVVWISQLNPMFVAGWVGMLITGLNMMPVGQLDGGHVTYTLFGEWAHTIAKATMVFAIAFMVYFQTMMMILMVVLLLLVGTNHPPTRDDKVPLGWFRWSIGLASLLIPVFCFPPRVFIIQ